MKKTALRVALLVVCALVIFGVRLAFGARLMARFDALIPLGANSIMSIKDELGMVAKFTPPTVADGKVYVVTFSGKVCVYVPK